MNVWVDHSQGHTKVWLVLLEGFLEALIKMMTSELKSQRTGRGRNDGMVICYCIFPDGLVIDTNTSEIAVDFITG